VILFEKHESQPAGSRDKPFGWVVLGFVAIGLGAYALWRLVQAVADPEGEGSDPSGIASHVGHGAAALGYSVLAFTAGQLVVTSGGGSSPKDWTASLLSLPLGWVVVVGSRYRRGWLRSS
jgi:hypothetical protein